MEPLNYQHTVICSYLMGKGKICSWALTQVHMHTQICIETTHTYTYAYVNIHINTQTQCTDLPTHKHVHTYTHPCTYTYTNAYTHTQTCPLSEENMAGYWPSLGFCLSMKHLFLPSVLYIFHSTKVWGQQTSPGSQVWTVFNKVWQLRMVFTSKNGLHK